MWIQWLETTLHYKDAISTERTEVEEVKIKKVKVESKLDKAKATAEQLQKKLHETKCQLAALTRLRLLRRQRSRTLSTLQGDQAL